MAQHQTPNPSPTPNPITTARFLSPSEVAEILGVSYVTVTRLIHSGKLPAARIGRILRISNADLNTYLRINRGATE